jgi:hypothetical protein
MTDHYLLNVHKNGRFRCLSREAQAYWTKEGAEVGDLLRSETPLPFSAIVDAYAESLLEHPEAIRPGDSPQAPNAARLRRVLGRLVAHGLVRRVPAPFPAEARS